MLSLSGQQGADEFPPCAARHEPHDGNFGLQPGKVRVSTNHLAGHDDKGSAVGFTRNQRDFLLSLTSCMVALFLPEALFMCKYMILKGAKMTSCQRANSMPY